MPVFGASPAPSQPALPAEARQLEGKDLTPSVEVPLPGGSSLQPEFSEDGKSLSFVTLDLRVDLVKVTLSVWPFLVGGIEVLCLLAWLLVFARVRRRPRARGLPHCRRCNYSLVGSVAESGGGRGWRMAPGTRCPECGVDLARLRPIRGRSTGRRLLGPTLVLGVCLALYAAMWIGKLPTKPGALPDWVPIVVWDRADRLATDRGVSWLKSNRSASTRVLTLDVRAGRVVSSFRTRHYGVPTLVHTRTGFEFLFLCQGSPSPGVTCLNVHSGRRIARATPEDLGIHGGAKRMEVAGACETNGVLRAVVVVDDGSSSRLVEWRPLTGEHCVIGEGRGWNICVLIDGGPEASIVCFYDKGRRARLWTWTFRAGESSPTGVSREVEIPGDPFRRFEFAGLSRDRSNAYFADGDDLLTAELCTGAWVGDIRKLPHDSREQIVVSESGRLAAARSPGWAWYKLYDTTRGVELGRFAFPEGAEGPVFSPDDRHFVVCDASSINRKSPLGKIRIYEVPERGEPGGETGNAR